ncbi:hypothetical protein [Pseudomonas fluorescens]|uniref:hypothetical protein n=1 Tax=Pseudomonas fluorescens TaxID=294 RepID=UPI000B5B5BEA|nr:hypothetical protein [Pseudomonas fluorescens]
MSDESVSVIRFTLFKHSRTSFLAALDEAGLTHTSLEHFSNRPQGAGFVEAVSALTDAMPWNVIGKVILAWIEARKSRSVMIQMEDGVVKIEAKGYSSADVERFLKASVGVRVIDTEPVEEKAGIEGSD